MATLANITDANGNNVLHITVTDPTVAAADLNTLNGKTGYTIDATAVGTFTGTLSELTTLYNAVGNNEISRSGSENITDTDALIATSDEITLDGTSTGVITATIAEHDMATLASIADANGNNALSITVTDATVAAADLNTLDGKTTVAITDGGITTVTGAYADVHTAFANSATDGLGGDEDANVSGNLAVADEATLDAQTTGVITATIAEHDMATLASIADANGNNALSITVTDATVAAADLNTLDGKTTVAITDGGITTVTGAYADVHTAFANSATDGLGGDEAVTLTDTTMTATDLNTLDNDTTGTIDASSVTSATGTLTDLNTAFGSAGISGLGSTNATMSDTNVTGLDLATLEGYTSGTINSDSGTLTIDTLNGLALSGTAADDTFDFVSGGAATGVSISNFEVGGVNDDIDLDGNQVNTGGTVYEEGTTGTIGANTALYVYTGNDLTSADAAGIQVLFDGTNANGNNLAFNAANDELFFVASDGSDTYLFNITDTNGDGEFTTADSETLVATLVGVTDASTLTSADFVDFQ